MPATTPARDRLTRTAADLRAHGATLDVPTAGAAWGIARRKAYELARDGRFPVEVLRIGGRFRVRTADVLDALGLD